VSRSEREEVRLLREIRTLLGRIYDELNPSAVTATIGGLMPLTVGGTTTATLGFVDAAGAAAAPPTGDGSGLVVTFTSDTPAVATVGTAVAGTDAAGNGNYTATVTGVSAGDYNLGATVLNASGAALEDDDGVTAFIQPAPVPGTVTASTTNQATTAVITIA
jgi:hypothetical protein